MSAPSEPAVDNEPIFRLAEECEELFGKDLSRLESSGPNIFRLFEEYQQRFIAWTAYLGVFAKQNVCLDHRLRHYPDLQDLVLRLLDILKTNLSQLVDPQITKEHNPISPEKKHGYNMLAVETDILTAVDGAIDRLNRLGIAIRQSSTRSTMAGGPSDITAYNSFKELARIYVQVLYPYASAELHDQLSKSMASRYDRIVTRQARQSQLQTRRLKPAIALPLIMEDVEMTSHSKMAESGSKVESLFQQRTENKGHFAPLPRRVDALRSEASSVNRPMVDQMMSSPSKAGSRKTKETSSIQVNLVGYPKAPQALNSSNYITCEWCFETRKKGEFEGDEWRKHVDRDLKTYVCISGKCAGRHEPKSFTTFKMWNDHMLAQHGSAWHQEVQPSSSWVCAVCNDSSNSFRNPQALYEHMEGAHQFSEAQLEAIVQQSRIQVRRRPDICPLCCFRVEEDPKTSFKPTGPERSEAVEHGKRQQEPPVLESSPKRARTSIDLGKPAGEMLGEASKSSTGQGGETNSATEDPALSRVKSMARHIAMHLQGLMDLTIRLMSVHDNNAEALSQGSSVDLVDDGDNSTRKMPTHSDNESQSRDSTAMSISDRGSIGGEEHDINHAAEHIPETDAHAVDAVWTRVNQSIDDERGEPAPKEIAVLKFSQPDEIDLTIIRHLFPDATGELQRLLARSITARKRRLRLLYTHKQKLRVRPVTLNDVPLSGASPEIPIRKPEPAVSALESVGRNFDKLEPAKAVATTSLPLTMQTGVSIKLEYSNLVRLRVGDDGAGCICQICHESIPVSTFSSPSSWRKHVDNDLQPYVCLYSCCSTVAFSNKRDWLTHLEDSHEKDWIQSISPEAYWACPLHPDNIAVPTFTRRHEFTQHVAESHAADVEDDSTLVDRLLEVAMRTSPLPPGICPLCRFSLAETTAQMSVHIAGHLQSIAFMSLRLNTLEFDDFATDSESALSCAHEPDARTRTTLVVDDDMDLVSLDSDSNFEYTSELMDEVPDTETAVEWPGMIGSLGWESSSDPLLEQLRSQQMRTSPARTATEVGSDIVLPVRLPASQPKTDTSASGQPPSIVDFLSETVPEKRHVAATEHPDASDGAYRRTKFYVGDEVYLLDSGTREGPYFVASVPSVGKCILSQENGEAVRNGEEVDVDFVEDAE